MAERDLLFETLAIMMIVVVPVFVLTALFAWRYRAGNRKARYQPGWTSSLAVEAVIWLVPAAIVVVLGCYVWNDSHKLDPYRALDSPVEPLVVEVVAEDWKWLFLYPEQGIASVNELVFPAGRPLSLKITSDTVMNAFYVPALGSQIYAMAGMVTRLHLLAHEPGRFLGRNSQYSGAGFSRQTFEVRATAPADFDTWVAEVRASATVLDAAAYDALREPSIAHPVTHYAAFQEGLFAAIVKRYMASRGRDDGAADDRSGGG